MSPVPFSQDRLDSWKAIASYLNRGVRTVQRWEREKGLPVRRMPGGDQPRVYALKCEVDKWWDSRGSDRPPENDVPPHTARWFLYSWLFGAGALVILTAGVSVSFRAGREPADMKPLPLVSMGGSAVRPALSADGSRVAFVWNAPQNLAHNSSESRSGIYVQKIGNSELPLRLSRNENDWNPTWSPDGRYVAFMRGSGSDMAIMVVPALGGAEQIVDTVHSSRVSRLCWLPDSKWLLLSMRNSLNEPLALWVLSVETGERRQLLASPKVVAYSGDTQGDLVQGLSPDGLTFAFSRSKGTAVYDLYCVRITREVKAAGEPWRVADRSFNFFAGAAWTANGDIVFSASDDLPRLWRVPVTGNAHPRLLAFGAPRADWPAIAGSEGRLLYQAGSLTTNLWRYDLQTKESEMLMGAGYNSLAPQYSPDGRRIAFQSTRSGSLEVWKCDANGENLHRLTFFGGPACGTPRWSPDGRSLAFDSRAEGKSQIYVIPADGGRPRRLTQGDSQNQMPAWSRDGKWIYFESDRSGEWRIWKEPAGGGPGIAVTRNISGAAFESADGRHVYVATANYVGGSQLQGRLFRVPATGGEEVLIAPRVLDCFSFSVAARGIYFMADSETLEYIDAGTGRTQTFAILKKSPAFNGITVSPDEKFLLYPAIDRRMSDIMIVENFR